MKPRPAESAPAPSLKPGEATDPQATAEAQQPDAVREIVESFIVALLLAFVFRAFIVEAFVIPTGSMAPTLLGHHFGLRCSACGYRFAIDPDTDNNRSGWYSPPEVLCPMCHLPIPLTNRKPANADAGDRILVLKYVYQFQEPRRWDVVVFKNPKDPDQNYIKRLVGKPNESLAILEGNVYARPEGSDEWSILRKTDRPEVQRTVWVPVYDSRYTPLDGGQSPARGAQALWSLPWYDPFPAQGGHWGLKDRRSYRYASDALGTIRFDFGQQIEGGQNGQGPGLYAYNQLSEGYSRWDEPVEDVRVSAWFQPDQPGLSLTLQTTARIDRADPQAGPATLKALVEANGAASLVALTGGDAEPRVLDSGRVKPLEPGIAQEVALQYVDQELSLWVGGDKALSWSYELPMRQLLQRTGPAQWPRIAISVSGSPVTLHRVRVERDLYYSSRRGKKLALGGIIKRRGGINHEPLTIGDDQFFCMGDNSPRSLDSRYWEEINPWITAQMFPGQTQEEALGLVPRQLLIGRAFLVYFPAPHRMYPGGWPVIPNVGKMRPID